MVAVLAALGTMAAIAAVGWLLGRSGALGPGAEHVLSRTVFLVCAPCLLLVTIAHSDLHALLSRVAVVTALSTAAVALIALVVLRLVWHRPAGDAAIGTLAVGYLNAGNLGIPIAVYLLGDAVAVVPTLLFQQLILVPSAFSVLDVGPGGGGRLSRALRPLRNPIIIGSLTGLALAGASWDLPEVVYEPFRLIGAAAPPLALVAFGLSLARTQGLGRDRITADLGLVVALRSLVHPVLAWVVGRAIGLDGAPLLAVVTMASLPTAQNVLVYALRYGRAAPLARDAGLVTTVLALPLLLVVAATLG